MRLSSLPEKHIILSSQTFGNQAAVFLISKYGTVYFYSVILFTYWPIASQSTIPTIDEVVASMTDNDPVHRLNAKEAKDRLGTTFYSMAPELLLIRPDIDRHGTVLKQQAQIRWKTLTTYGQIECVTISSLVMICEDTVSPCARPTNHYLCNFLPDLQMRYSPPLCPEYGRFIDPQADDSSIVIVACLQYL